jgi:hypothetical protein
VSKKPTFVAGAGGRRNDRLSRVLRQQRFIEIGGEPHIPRQEQAYRHSSALRTRRVENEEGDSGARAHGSPSSRLSHKRFAQDEALVVCRVIRSECNVKKDCIKDCHVTCETLRLEGKCWNLGHPYRGSVVRDTTL